MAFQALLVWLLITDLQSTDAGAALTKGLLDTGKIDKKNLVVMSAWQYAGAGLVNNYFLSLPLCFFAFPRPCLDSACRDVLPEICRRCLCQSLSYNFL